MTAPLVLRPRERRLALIAALVVGSYAVISWIVEPLWDRSRELAHRLEAQSSKLSAFSELLQQAPVIEQDHARIAAYLTPEEDEEGRAFLHALETLSRRTNLQLNLKPRPAKGDERLRRFEVEVDLEGSQQSLLAFLDELLRMPELLAIERLRISSSSFKREPSLRASVVVQKLTLLH
jgi:hypothetical protein